MKFCISCGQKIEDNSNFCDFCGAVQNKPVNNEVVEAVEKVIEKTEQGICTVPSMQPAQSKFAPPSGQAIHQAQGMPPVQNKFAPASGQAIHQAQGMPPVQSKFAPPSGQSIQPAQNMFTSPSMQPAQNMYVPQNIQQLQNAGASNMDVSSTQTANKIKKKKSAGKVFGIIAAILVLALVAGGVTYYFLVIKPNGNEKGIPEIKYSLMDETLTPTVSCEAVDTIYPALYNSMDYIIVFEGSCEQGDTDVLVEVEIPGYTEKYSQKFTLNRQLTQIYVKPQFSAKKEDLGSQKKAQINFKVTDINTNKIISQDTKPVSIMSLFDFNLNLETRCNAWAWLTPENEYVKKLKQEAVGCLEEITDGKYNSIISYQGDDDSMYYECVAMMVALSNMGVRYNDSGYSSSQSGDYLQRVVFPEDVITSKSGICIETSMLIASALQSSGYNAMLVFTTGHCQVAVEVGDCTGEYYMIETTRLPVDGLRMGDIVWYMTQDEWNSYLADRKGICIPCNLATNYGFTPLFN